MKSSQWSVSKAHQNKNQACGSDFYKSKNIYHGSTEKLSNCSKEKYRGMKVEKREKK